MNTFILFHTLCGLHTAFFFFFFWYIITVSADYYSILVFWGKNQKMELGRKKRDRERERERKSMEFFQVRLIPTM